jgi:hypothetical protein
MPSLLSLIQRLYPSLDWTKEFMQWQYFDNPAGEAKVWLCLNENQPVGSVTALPHVVWVHDRASVGYRVQDVLTDPNFRGRSIYRKLSEACYAFLDAEEMAVHFTFPNENSDRVFRTSGWSPVGDIPFWTAKPEEKTRGKDLLGRCRLLDTFSTLDEDVWASWRRAKFIGIDKNSAFLNWKYFGNPRAKYECYRIDHNQSNMVFILKKFRNQAGDTFLHLCDLFYSQFDAPALSDVFSIVHARAVLEEASVITTWISPDNELAPLALAAGFSYSPVTSRSYFLRSSNAPAHAYFSTWNIRMGDSDVY